MNRKILFSALLFSAVVWITPARSQSQTAIAHLGLGGVSMLVADSTLENAIAADCAYDTLPGDYGATITSIRIDYVGGTYYLVGHGSSSMMLSLNRIYTLTVDGNNDLKLVTSSDGLAVCQGCDVCSSVGPDCSGCDGGTGNNGAKCEKSHPGGLGGGHLGGAFY